MKNSFKLKKRLDCIKIWSLPHAGKSGTCPERREVRRKKLLFSSFIM